MEKVAFIDAETDGLYGPFLSIAAIICDENGRELDSFYHRVCCKESDISDSWTREHVYPYLGQGIGHENEAELVETFWRFYCSHRDCIWIGDIIYPVESRLFIKCVEADGGNRMLQGPFPLLDLGSMLYARGIDVQRERRDMVDCTGYNLHNALDDVRMTRDIWAQYIR